MLVDNTQEVKKLLQFESNRYYYKFAVLVRKKDYAEDECPLLCKEGRREVCVHQWLVSSMEEYNKLLPDMLTYMNLFKSRLYVATDRKDLYKSLQYCRDKAMMMLDQVMLGQTNVSCRYLNKLVNSATSVKESSSKDGKCWLFDVDAKDKDVLIAMKIFCADHYLCTLETKSGYHVVCRKRIDPFSVPMFDSVTIKENAMALVAMY